MEKIDVKNITAELAGGARVDSIAVSPDNFDPDQIGPGKRVVLHFELRLADGTVIDSNFSGNAVSFTVGDGNLLPGFEQVIFGMRKGQEQTFEVVADQAFGQVNPDNVQRFARYRFPADLVLEKGLVINFADADGNDQPGVVTDFSAERVSVDFNHPLAGRDIIFQVEILDVSNQE